MTGDASGILNLNSNGTNVVAVSSTGMAVTGTLAATGAVSGTTGTFTSTLGVTGAITGSSTVAGSTGILYPLTSGTAVASTSGTSIDFTGIPSWVKRITVMFSGVSTSGASNPQIQVGSGSVSTTGYVSFSGYAGASTSVLTITTGLLWDSGGSGTELRNGIMTINLLGSNTWVSGVTGGFSQGASIFMYSGGGTTPALAGALDRIRITTVNGTDAFDAGSINILYE
jgi:hypothetical protein